MSIARSSAWFAAGTLLSRVSGLVRESVLMAVFGASGAMDAFLVAFRIPNLLRDLVAEGALGNAVTKVYSELYEQDKAKARDFLAQAIVLTLSAVSAICALGMIGARFLVSGFTFLGADNHRGPAWLDLTVALTQSLFPYLMLAAVGAVAMGALHRHNRFFLTALAPIAFNVGNIAGALAGAAWFPKDSAIWGLVIGVIVGGLAHTLWQIAGLWRVGLQGASWPSLSLTADTRKCLRLMGPMILGGGAAQINVLISTNFATSLVVGSVTWLNAAFRLLQLPVGLFAVAVGSVALPALTRSIVRAGGTVGPETGALLQRAVEIVLWLTMPCLLFFLWFGHPLVSLLYQWAAFDGLDVDQTTLALQAYAFAVIGYGLIKVLTSFYYATNHTRFPMVISIVSIGTNLLFNTFLVAYGDMGHVGLAWTTSISLSLNAAILIAGLCRFPHLALDKRRVMRHGLYLALSVGLAALLCFGLGSVKDYFYNINGLHHKWKHLLALGSFGILMVISFAGPSWLAFRQSTSRTTG